jgi:D-amino-acid dehydrogenase
MNGTDGETLSGGTGSGSRTIVLGAGIVGLSAAYFLARRGAPVTVVEREAIGEGASCGNAGIIAPGHPPLPRPELLSRIPRLLLDRRGPVYVALRLDPALPGWMWSFLLACRKRRYERSLDILAALGRAAGTCFREIVEEEGIDCEYHPRGWLEVFRTERALEKARRDADHLRRFGYPVDELSGNDLREREPAFLEEVHGALHYRDAAFANPAAFVRGLAAAAEGQGAKLVTGAEVTGIRIGGGRFRGVDLAGGRHLEGERLVLAAGAWTTELARGIGLRIPMQAGKGYHVNLGGTGIRPSTTCVLAEVFVAVTPLSGGLRLAGTVELSGLNLRMVERRLDRLASGARSYLRGIEGARVESTWCGLRPLTADGLPVVGWAPGVQGVFVATGHAMMGFLLGPLTGKLTSQALLDESPSMDVAPFGADRF